MLAERATSAKMAGIPNRVTTELPEGALERGLL
jgi:hypothetical protein